ncbi:MAG: hypothetical protein IKO84_01870 [Butyrivibrio sp.]|nr:hypothetical protein [Butyrivibrio sp.]
MKVQWKICGFRLKRIRRNVKIITTLLHAHIGSKREIDIVKGHHEAEVGLDLERRGLLENIKRDPTGAAEFIEENGTKWDVKSFNSNYPVKKGGFELNRVMRTINKSLEKQENVIVDTLNMSQEHITELKAAVKANGIDDKVIFWP